MAIEPNADDMEPEMGSSGSMKKKSVVLFVWLPVIAMFTAAGGLFGSFGSIVGGTIGAIVVIGISKLIRKYRVIQFKKTRGDYDPVIQANKEAASQAIEKTGKLTSGAIGLIKDAGEAVAEKLEQRATQGKDSSPETNGFVQDDIADRLEKLSNLHKQGHISDEEFDQQRSRILDEV